MLPTQAQPANSMAYITWLAQIQSTCLCDSLHQTVENSLLLLCCDACLLAGWLSLVHGQAATLPSSAAENTPCSI
jgi:hypothetical protein